MAFNIQSWGIISGAVNNRVVTLQNNTFVGVPNVFTYISATDTVATIAAANYFAQVAPDINIGDLIYAVGTDTSDFLTVVTVTLQPPAVTVVTGAAIGNVVGPASSVLYQPAIFSSTTGKVIEGGLQWFDQTITPATIAPYANYLADKSTLVTLNMPATVPFGATMIIAGFGAGGWLVK